MNCSTIFGTLQKNLKEFTATIKTRPYTLIRANQSA